MPDDVSRCTWHSPLQLATCHAKAVTAAHAAQTHPEALEHTTANTTSTDKVFDKGHERAMTVRALSVEFGVFPNQ